MLATVSRRAHLARQSRLSTKHVGFRHYCARAPTRGGGLGDAGDRFESSFPRLSASAASSAQIEARGLCNLCVRALARGGGYAGDRFASSSLRESTSAQDEARGLPVLCTSLGTRL